MSSIDFPLHACDFTLGLASQRCTGCGEVLRGDELYANRCVGCEAERAEARARYERTRPVASPSVLPGTLHVRSSS